MKEMLDIPIIATVVSECDDIDGKLKAGSKYIKRIRRGKNYFLVKNDQGPIWKGTPYYSNWWAY